ncbi:MAG: hypothetical protein IIV97_03930, partial [Oscillospiraceae bacterium]|nr:hypothetical protein [Oscillospiraceae bacterium]
VEESNPADGVTKSFSIGGISDSLISYWTIADGFVFNLDSDGILHSKGCEMEKCNFKNGQIGGFEFDGDSIRISHVGIYPAYSAGVRCTMETELCSTGVWYTLYYNGEVVGGPQREPFNEA